MFILATWWALLRESGCLSILIVGEHLFFSLVFFQGNFSQDVSKVRRPDVVCGTARSLRGYNKTLASRSHYAVRFSVTQQSEAKSISYRRMTCTAKENVSMSFKIPGLEYVHKKFLGQRKTVEE
jgi:hypothetical protein